MMANRIKALAAALLAGLMVFSFAGCYGDTNEWVMKVGDTQIDTGVYLGYMVSNYLSAQNQVTDTSKDLFSQKIEEKNAETWILDETMDNCLTYAYVTQTFDTLKLKLTDDDNSSIDSSTESTWSQMSYALEKNGCSKASLKKILTCATKSNKLFEYYYYEGGERAVSVADQKTYFNENYAKMKSTMEYLFDTSTYTALSDTEKANLQKKLRGLVSKITGGQDFDTVVDAYNEEKSASAAAAASSSATSSVSTEASATSKEASSVDPDRYVTVVPKTGSSYPDDFLTKLFSMKTGETAMVETDNYLFLAQRMSLENDETNFKKYQTAIISSMKSDEFQKELLAEGKKLKLTKNDAAFSRFKPKNITGRVQSSSMVISTATSSEA